ncbi:flavin reductase family protein [Amycolatopsis circi]|uniref:flavin reductase family protein n=1 Tax=Amycolatopsis circi TaxID=871959 RepID=UPI000E226B20|nr:flavin reductase family protein [Amycolatopsis circi]
MDSVVIDPPVLYPGTPVVLLSSANADGTTNLAPMSSAWVLGRTAVLGLGSTGHTFANLRDRPDCVLNYPSADLWPAVERLAGLTGAPVVPAHKAGQFRTERDKFGAARLTPVPADLVAVDRVAECPLQVECRVTAARHPGDPALGVVEAEVLRVHVHPALAEPDLRHIRVAAWEPLFYLFRHYVGRGPELGRTFRATTAESAPVSPR